MKPCKDCIVFAICKNKPLIKCAILYEYYSKNDVDILHLDLITSFLNKKEWHFSEDGGLVIYTPIKTKDVEDKICRPNVAYQLADGNVSYYEKRNSMDARLFRLPSVKV